VRDTPFKLVMRVRFDSSRPLSASLRRPYELRQHVFTSGGPFAPEALHFLETECRVKMKRGDVIRPGHIEHFVRTGESPAQAGLRQLSGDTPAPPRRIHQDAAEVATSRSSRARLIRCQLDDPAEDVTVPTLYLHGTQDGCHGMPQEQVNRVPDRCGPGSQSELIDGVGHFLMVQRPPTPTSGSWTSWLPNAAINPARLTQQA
jgi:pimeloyl-ACP methyl ester carboxylesterase